jgi:hypothetical protein
MFKAYLNIGVARLEYYPLFTMANIVIKDKGNVKINNGLAHTAVRFLCLRFGAHS